MNKIRLVKMLLLILLSSNAFITAYANQDANLQASNANDRFIYFGASVGIAEPVRKSFLHKDSETRIDLKRSSMFSGHIGYIFYPQMAIELSVTHQPKYRVGYLLPEKPNLGINDKTYGITKLLSQVYTINLVYYFNNIYHDIKPYVIVGAGFSRMDVKHSTASAKIQNNDVEIFRVNKTKTNAPTYQVGLGVSKEIVTGLSLDLSAKLQIMSNVKVKYDVFDSSTGEFRVQPPIKKTLGIWEFALGILYTIPM